jgi:lysophospholipase L1-like esterase
MKSLFYSVLFIFSVTACSNSDDGGGAAGPKIINSKPGAGSIYVMGDSLAYGTGSSVDSLFTPSLCLAAEFTGATVSNYAIPGFKTNELVNNVPYYLGQPPKLAFISTGGNDALSEYYQPGSYPADKSVRELKRIILQFQTAGAVVVYLAINPPYDPTAAKRLQDMGKVARENGAIVVDGMAGLWNTAKMSDDLHPNDDGYEVMCDRIIQAVSAHYP